MPKQVYSWGKVTTGDIISFRYKGVKSKPSLTTILVLNRKIQLHKKHGKTDFYLVGLKLESQGVVPQIKNKDELVELLERVGVIEVVNMADEIYRVEVKGTGPKGFRQRNYQRLKKYIEQNKVYRTYNYTEAKKSAVFLEPVKLPKNTVEVLNENQLWDYST